MDALRKVGVGVVFPPVLKWKHRDTFPRDCLASLPVKRKAPNDQHCNNQQQSPDDDEVENPPSGALNRFCLDLIEIFRPYSSFGGKFVNPGKEHRDWKSGRERDDDETHGGIRYFKKRENLRRELREKPCDDPVGNRSAINVAPL